MQKRRSYGDDGARRLLSKLPIYEPNIQDVQHRQGREFLTPDGRVSVYSLGEAAPTEDWFLPTLSELIAACGEKFSSLILVGFSVFVLIFGG